MNRLNPESQQIQRWEYVKASGIKITGLEKVREKLQRIAKNAQETVRSLNGRSVAVTIPESARYPDGTSVRQVAALVEYGTARMEPRPFMRLARAENNAKWQAMLRAGAKEVAAGKTTAARVLRRVGDEMKHDIQASVEAVGAVRTGRLRDSFEVQVR